MSDVPVQVVVAAFQDENAAKEALGKLKEAQKQKLIKIDDAAVIRKDGEGKLHIKETADMGGGKGAGVGAIAGGVIGLFGGPGGVVVGAGVGAAVGGVVAKLHDGGIKDDKLKALGDGLQPNTSAIVAIVEHKWVEQVQKELDAAATQVVVEGITADIAEQLAAGKDVAMTAVATEEGVAIARVAASDSEMDAEKVVVTEDAVEVTAVAATMEEADDESDTQDDESPEKTSDAN